MSSGSSIGSKATKSIVALTSRTFILNIINFLGAFFLTVYLSPKDFGVFIVVSTITEILAYFSDIGLAAALIQKKTELHPKEIAATFTFQNVLILTWIGLLMLAAPYIQSWYDFGDEGIILLYALLIAFFISSLKTIPSVLCERNLDFTKVVIPQIVESLVYNIIIIFLAWLGWGVHSYTVAVLARAILGTITMYILVPWKPQLYWSLDYLRDLLKFGISYQGNSLLAMFKDRISLLVLAKVIGIEAMGFLGWAEKWAHLPLRYILDASIRVSFPLFSRLQDDKEKAAQAVEKYLYLISALVFPALAGAYLLMPEMIEAIPKYSKWIAALPAFNTYLVAAALGAILNVFTNFLIGIGKMRQMLTMMLGWTVMTLILYPWFASMWGITGVALASLIVNATFFIPYIVVRKFVGRPLLKSILPATVSSLGMLAVGLLVIPYLPDNFWVKITGIILSGGTTYAALFWILDRQRLMENVNQFLAMSGMVKSRRGNS